MGCAAVDQAAPTPERVQVESAATPQSPTFEPEPTLTPVATRSAEAPHPQASPSPALTAVPGSPAASDRERFDGFVAFMTNNVGAQRDLVDAVIAAIDAADRGQELRRLTVRVEVISEQQLAWLESNPAAACFAPLHNRQADAARSFADWGRLLREWYFTGQDRTVFDLRCLHPGDGADHA